MQVAEGVAKGGGGGASRGMRLRAQGTQAMPLASGLALVMICLILKQSNIYEQFENGSYGNGILLDLNLQKCSGIIFTSTFSAEKMPCILQNMLKSFLKPAVCVKLTTLWLPFVSHNSCKTVYILI